MIYLVNIMASLLFLMLQTVILPGFFSGGTSYDLMLLLILHLGFTLSFSKSLSVVLFSGILADSFSGGAFGVFTTTYFWFFVLIRGMIRYLHVDSRVLIVFAPIAGVVMENLVVFMSALMGASSLVFSPDVIRIMMWQIFWAALTGPFILRCLSMVQQRGQELSHRIAERGEDL